MRAAITIKATCNGTTHLFDFLGSSFQQLHDQLAEIFGYVSVVVKYVDGDVNLITISSDSELQHAFTVVEKLRLEVTPVVTPTQPLYPAQQQATSAVYIPPAADNVTYVPTAANNMVYPPAQSNNMFVSLPAPPVQANNMYAPPVQANNMHAPPVQANNMYAPPVQADNMYAPPVQASNMYAPPVQANNMYAPPVQAINVAYVPPAQVNNVIPRPGPFVAGNWHDYKRLCKAYKKTLPKDQRPAYWAHFKQEKRQVNGQRKAMGAQTREERKQLKAVYKQAKKEQKILRKSGNAYPPAVQAPPAAYGAPVTNLNVTYVPPNVQVPPATYVPHATYVPVAPITYVPNMQAPPASEVMLLDGASVASNTYVDVNMAAVKKECKAEKKSLERRL